MQLIVPIFGSAVENKVFSIARGNPGCGGTWFSLIKLAVMLSAQENLVNVTIVTSHNFTITNQPSRLRIVHFNSFHEFLMEFDSNFPDAFIVSTVSDLL